MAVIGMNDQEELKFFLDNAHLSAEDYRSQYKKFLEDRRLKLYGPFQLELPISVPNSRKITADEIKLAILKTMRFHKGFSLCATECRFMDVAGISGRDENIEVEVKISKSDLYHDFHKDKHEKYRGGTSYIPYIVPDKFFYCYPEYMDNEQLREDIKNVNPSYGIMLYDPYYYTYRIVKSAKNLNPNEISRNNFRSELTKRCTCQLITLMEKVINK